MHIFALEPHTRMSLLCMRRYRKTDGHLGNRVAVFSLYPTLAHRWLIFVAEMTTYYYRTLEEALKKAKAAGKRPGCWYGGIILRSGKRGFAVYKEGKVIEQYTVIAR